jgi:hypothetical protein
LIERDWQKMGLRGSKSTIKLMWSLIVLATLNNFPCNCYNRFMTAAIAIKLFVANSLTSVRERWLHCRSYLNRLIKIRQFKFLIWILYFKNSYNLILKSGPSDIDWTLHMSWLHAVCACIESNSLNLKQSINWLLLID